MSQESQSATARIPKFETRQEEAEFWDTHDLTDYLDELEDVEVKFGDNLSGRVSIHLDADSLSKVCELACEKGISPAALMRTWVMEHLKASSSTSHRFRS